MLKIDFGLLDIRCWIFGHKTLDVDCTFKN